VLGRLSGPDWNRPGRRPGAGTKRFEEPKPQRGARDNLEVAQPLALAFLAGMIVWHMLQSRLRRTEIEAALKQDMLNRACPDEIERVLRAPLSGSYDSVDELYAVMAGARFHCGQRNSNSD
jgi:hypothetical protein